VPIFLALGSGPGLGLAVARRFARENYRAVLTTRTAADAAPLVDALTSEGASAEGQAIDLADPHDIERVVRTVGESHGHIDLLHFNASVWREKDVLTLSVDDLLADVAVGVGALLPAVQAARPFLDPGARVLVTGSVAADRPSPRAATLGVQKAGVRNLVSSIDQALADVGVRAVAVQINGVLGQPGFDVAVIADAMWIAATRPTDAWTTDVAFG
jgi:NAD(P)-dependent dehydrogenase (short-subunit alcohol dehydrogenase family)